MSDIEEDYKVVRQTIIDKVSEACKLLKEANELVSKTNISGSFGDEYESRDSDKAEYLKDLMDIEYQMSREDRNSKASEYQSLLELSESLRKFYGVLDDSGWRTSSFDCF